VVACFSYITQEILRRRIVKMAEIKVGDRVRVKDRPDWPGGYKIASSEGSVIEVQKPWGYVVIHLEKTNASIDLGITLTLREEGLEKI